MRKRRINMVMWLCGYVAALLCGYVATPVFAQEHPAAEVFSNRVIVKFKKPEAMGYKISQMVNQGIEVEGKLLLDNTFTVEAPEGEREEVIANLNQDPDIEYAEPDYVVYAHGVPIDPGFGEQWGLHNTGQTGGTADADIDAPEAWDLTSGSSSVKVAILDTGIDQNHPDLSSKVEQWVSFCESGHVVRSDGCVSVCPDENDYFGHGTHVGGITAAVTNNQVGVAGTGYDTHLFSVKVLDDTCGGGFNSWVASGIAWAVENGAKVINMSLGSYSYSQTIKDAVDDAWEGGVVVVNSAGNCGQGGSNCPGVNPIGYPAAHESVIGVASTTSSDSKSSFSEYGTWVSVAAPGSSIYSTAPTHSYTINGDLNYEYLSGTSMACPFVSGLAGLLFSVDSSLTAVDVRNLIEQNADNIPGTGSYWTHGRINAYQSVLAAMGDVTATPTPTPTATVTPTPTPTPTGGVTATPTPTSVPFNCSLDGDFDGSGTVDEADFTLWTTAFSEGRAALPCFEYWRRNRY